MYSELQSSLKRLTETTPSQGRQELLLPVVAYLSTRFVEKPVVNLRFVCTHNARRSQLAQLLTASLAEWLGLPLETSSAGTAQTRLHPTVAKVLEELGFRFEKLEGTQPKYSIYFKEGMDPILAYSKTLEEAMEDGKGFVAVMVCNHADAHCPTVLGAEQRFSVPYEDPGAADGLPEEKAAYFSTAAQIVSEWNWVFQQVKSFL